MTLLSYDRHHAGIVAQTESLNGAIRGADLTVPVPSCPGWNVGQLLRHLGGGHRWALEIVRTRADQPASDTHFRDLSAYTHENPDELAPWLTEGATRLAHALGEAGPEAEVWAPVRGGGSRFLARRFLHETVVHRADAVLALGLSYTLDRETALDALDEWMELGSLPQLFEAHPERRELLGPGRTIRLSATDTESGADWFVDLTGDCVVWSRAPESAAVTVRAPLVELLLLVYRRRSVRDGGFEVSGDGRLLDFWLDRVGFG
ncbi:maleylpyruvate isomerase family mycothiol-dependent enzyme [Nocardiopsis halotolerans]|uniref:maleylpyruvate isomerase family mycothiol-dependent enzyme n=1 Tax=Nocardiopsis halotolerans TaxID=124252 RepID=UPI00034806A8|nr:maleylpyruvate isomerase family mycothiol-dependent enzyme [Nocardiopsis halotolerans]